MTRDWLVKLRPRRRLVPIAEASCACAVRLGSAKGRVSEKLRLVKMAAYTLIRSGGGILTGLKCSLKTFTHVPQSCAALSRCKLSLNTQWRSSAQLSVQDRIESKRRAALQGGGQARIEAQHKRVKTQKTYSAYTGVEPRL